MKERNLSETPRGRDGGRGGGCQPVCVCQRGRGQTGNDEVIVKVRERSVGQRVSDTAMSSAAQAWAVPSLSSSLPVSLPAYLPPSVNPEFFLSASVVVTSGNRLLH